MIRYYFAARFSRNAEMRSHRDELEGAVLHSEVTSRWIDLHPDIVGAAQQTVSFTPGQLDADPEGCWKLGAHDIEDLDAADVIVSFTGEGDDTGRPSKGGRHIEHGYAIATGKRIVIVGQRENIFHTYPGTEVYPTWAAFLSHEVEIDA